MPAIFNSCPACLRKTDLPNNQRTLPIAVYEACKACNFWHRALLTGAIILALLTGFLLLHAALHSNTGVALTIGGILLTVIGGYLVFGRLELLIMIAGVLGGLTERQADITLQTRRARVGLVLVLLGLFLQAAGAFLSSLNPG